MEKKECISSIFIFYISGESPFVDTAVQDQEQWR